MSFYRRSTQSRSSGQTTNRPDMGQPFRMPQLVLVVMMLIFGISYVIYHLGDDSLRVPPGILVNESPTWHEAVMPSIELKGSTLSPIGTYDIRARVLAVDQHALSDELSRISPVDFLLGWGVMSDTAVIKQLDIKLQGRHFNVNAKYGAKLPPRFSQHYTLSYVLPANDEVARVVMRVRKDNVIRMQGYIVNIKTPDYFSFESKLPDEDGMMQWEFFLVDKIVIER